MKKHLLLAIASLLFLNNSLAQVQSTWEDDGSPRTYNYKLLVEARIAEYDISTKTFSSNIQIAERGSIFSLFGKHNADTVIVRFWEWESNQQKQQEFNYSNVATKEVKYFIISFDEFNEKAVKRYSTIPAFTAGTIIIPVKVRFNDFDFSKDFTLGPTIGARCRLSHYDNNYLNILFGFGITSVTLDSLSTGGNVKKVTDRPALTPSLGAVLEIRQGAQFGIFLGKDYISRKEEVDWRYQGKTWLSVGIGFTILSRQNSAAENKEGKQSDK